MTSADGIPRPSDVEARPAPSITQTCPGTRGLPHGHRSGAPGDRGPLRLAGVRALRERQVRRLRTDLGREPGPARQRAGCWERRSSPRRTTCSTSTVAAGTRSSTPRPAPTTTASTCRPCSRRWWQGGSVTATAPWSSRSRSPRSTSRATTSSPPRCRSSAACLWGVDLQKAQQAQTGAHPPKWDYQSSGVWGGHAIVSGAYEIGALEDVISWGEPDRGDRRVPPPPARRGVGGRVAVERRPSRLPAGRRPRGAGRGLQGAHRARPAAAGARAGGPAPTRSSGRPRRPGPRRATAATQNRWRPR